MALKWDGDGFRRRMELATHNGLNITMAQAVFQAKTNHEFINRTGLLEGSVRIYESAKRVGRFVKGTWGSVAVVYARAIEFGLPGRNRPYPFLRPAAAVVYPSLGRNIKAAFRRLRRR